MAVKYFFKETEQVSKKENDISVIIKSRVEQLIEDEGGEVTSFLLNLNHPHKEAEIKKSGEKAADFPVVQPIKKEPFGQKGFDTAIFLADTEVLRLAANYLTADEKENMLFVTGMKHENTRVLAHMLKCRSNRSMTGVEVGSGDVFSSLYPYQKKGYGLHAIFHSHPGGGIPTPSSIDMQLHQTLEKHGYSVIGGVFTKTAARFFSWRLNFKIVIGGNDYELYKGDPYTILFREPSDFIQRRFA